MIFEVADPGYPAWGWWWAAVVAVVAALWILLDVFVVRHGGFAVLAIFGGLAAIAIGSGVVATVEQGDAYGLAVEQGIESHGFENVDLTGRDFTASLDGEYFKGQVIEIETDVFQIVQIVSEEGVK